MGGYFLRGNIQAVVTETTGINIFKIPLFPAPCESKRPIGIRRW
jgi:hypothetical protein